MSVNEMIADLTVQTTNKNDNFPLSNQRQLSPAYHFSDFSLSRC